MKKFILITLLLSLTVGLLASCGVAGEAPSQGESSSTVQTSSSAAESGDETSALESSQPDQTSAETSDTVNLPEYVPGSIELIPPEEDDYHFERKYRITYYRIWGEWSELLDEEESADYEEWFEKHSEEHGYGESLEEMMLVSFVKRYNITREEFDQATEKFIAHNEELGWDSLYEEYEVPNADIIYTFDNEIINNYYRYA